MKTEMSDGEKRWRTAILPLNSTTHQAIDTLAQAAIKIVLVINANDELEGTISDGDIRRALLRGVGLDSPITEVIHRHPLVVPPGMGRDLVMQLMVANHIQQVPVVDGNNRLVGLHLWDDISLPAQRPNAMVIMAGGKGTRLRPHTESCPKPMLPLSGKPMLEHIIERAKAEGFRHFILAIHYLGHMIEAYFGDGQRLGVEIEYLREAEPLGTAGALGLISPLPQHPIVVTNGDVITDIHYTALLDFHVRHQAAATMAVRAHDWQHPFGVVEIKGLDIVGFQEKPVARTYINAGVYALNPEVLGLLGNGMVCDMPSLFEKLQTKGGRTVAYPMHEPWLDVGRPEDLRQARGQNGTDENEPVPPKEKA